MTYYSKIVIEYDYKMNDVFKYAFEIKVLTFL